MIDPIIPQPQPLRRAMKFPNVWREFLAFLLGVAFMFAGCYQYAKERLYTQDEMQELISGFGSMAADMGYRKGLQQCRRPGDRDA